MSIAAPITIHPRSDQPIPEAFVKPKVEHPYYDFGRLLSYNATFYFLVGGRGLGKTYGAKRIAIRKFVKNGDQFIYLRRYKHELKARDTFFADIQHEFPEWEFRSNGNTFECAPVSTAGDKGREWRIMGYVIALSTSQQVKSVAFPRVKTIIFDEFILENGAVHYLPDEAKVFLNFYSTVDRWQDKTTVYFIANAVSITNPYFLEYGILPTEDTEFMKLADGFIVCHFPKAEEFARSVLKTRFGKFIESTEYADYAVSNEFADNNDDLTGVKDPKAIYQFTLECKLGTFSVWNNRDADRWFAVRKRPGNELFFTLLPEKMTEQKTLLLYNDMTVQRLRNAYRTGKITFDNPGTRNMFLDLFKHR